MGMGRFWTLDEVEYLRKNYPYTDTKSFLLKVATN